MANNITNSASFSTANMKPLADEETAALWGQNVADNTGYLYYRKDDIAFPHERTSYATTVAPGNYERNYSFWHLLKGHQDTVEGTCTMSLIGAAGLSGNFTMSGTLSYDGTDEDTAGTTWITSATITNAGTLNFSTTVTAPTTDTWKKFNLKISGTAASNACIFTTELMDGKFCSYKA